MLMNHKVGMLARRLPLVELLAPASLLDLKFRSLQRRVLAACQRPMTLAALERTESGRPSEAAVTSALCLDKKRVRHFMATSFVVMHRLMTGRFFFSHFMVGT